MNKPIYKFYDMETMTQEKLNQLALERNDYAERLDKAKKCIKSLIKPKRQDNSFHRNPIYIVEMINLLEILGDKENE